MWVFLTISSTKHVMRPVQPIAETNSILLLLFFFLSARAQPVHFSYFPCCLQCPWHSFGMKKKHPFHLQFHLHFIFSPFHSLVFLKEILHLVKFSFTQS